MRRRPPSIVDFNSKSKQLEEEEEKMITIQQISEYDGKRGPRRQGRPFISLLNPENVWKQPFKYSLFITYLFGHASFSPPRKKIWKSFARNFALFAVLFAPSYFPSSSSPLSSRRRLFEFMAVSVREKDRCETRGSKIEGEKKDWIWAQNLCRDLLNSCEDKLTISRSQKHT